MQSGVGGDKVAAICMFIGPGSLYVLGLWPTSRSTSSTCGPTADSCLTVSRDHRGGADQPRSTNMTSKFQ